MRGFGALAIFAGMTADRPDREKKQSAFKAAFAVAVILLIVTWAGKYVLRIFGITPPGLEVAGGVIIALVGLSMLHSKTSAMSHTKAEGDVVRFLKCVGGRVKRDGNDDAGEDNPDKSDHDRQDL